MADFQSNRFINYSLGHLQERGCETPKKHSIYMLCLSVCFLYPMNIKTAESIKPKICKGHLFTLPRRAPGKVFSFVFQKLLYFLRFKIHKKYY